MLELIAAVVALATVGVPSVSEQRCAADETRAIVGARTVCLSYGATCRPRYQQRYRRYGFLCDGRYLDYDWEPLRRLLRVPTIAAGTSCPASPARRDADASGFPLYDFGPGPAQPTLDGSSGRAAIQLVWEPTEPPYLGWAGTKVLWGVPTYAGAVLIRGRQVDGPGELGFDLGPRWTRTVLPEIRLIGPEYDLRPAATFVRSPGCYAYQVDTFRSSYLIVFEARVAEAGSPKSSGRRHVQRPSAAGSAS
jgi:hypothetical protein